MAKAGHKGLACLSSGPVAAANCIRFYCPLLLRGAGSSRRFSLSPFLVLQMKETAENERRFTCLCKGGGVISLL